jgi:hypothetical protein
LHSLAISFGGGEAERRTGTCRRAKDVALLLGKFL